MQRLTDRTETPERALKRFSAIYMEGTAASGKTTAVQMMLKRHREAEHRIFFMNQEDAFRETPEALRKLLEKHRAGESQGNCCWFVFENLPGNLPEETAESLTDFVRKMPENWKAVFLSREQPPKAFLDLIWKRQMELIPQRELLFSREETAEMIQQAQSSLDSEELQTVTGGWAGCVDLMIRLAGTKDSAGRDGISAAELRKRYEVNSYIQEEILNTLSDREQQVMALAAVCPWISEQLCSEAGGMDPVRDVLQGLERKGLLIWRDQYKYWETAPLFSVKNGSDDFQGNAASGFGNMETGRTLGDWYERHGFLKEALWYCREFRNEEAWYACLIGHYREVPFLGISYTDILKCRDTSPEAAYLRGMCYRKSGDFCKISREAALIGKENPEIYLNLMFANPEMTLDEWLDLAEELSEEEKSRGSRKKFYIYEILGSSHTFLCGIRDLSELFACAKREENRKAQIWKKLFGEREWQAYCLARADFYLETGRGKELCEEDEDLLERIPRELLLNPETISRRDSREWEGGVACLYLYCLREMLWPDSDGKNRIFRLAEALSRSVHPICVRNAAAILGIFSRVLRNRENLNRWLRLMEDRKAAEMTCTEYVFRCRGYIIQRQYAKAGELLQRSIPFLKKTGMTRLCAEALFQQAVVNWHMEQHGQALQNVIESFLVTGSCRYVNFYTTYRSAGNEVLKSYVEWMQNNIPGGWNRKKKYNYGNVLRMPVEDYLNLILRKAKRSGQKELLPGTADQGDTLTMMETIVLQAICQGLSNAEIGEQQNLKITTVKSHIYNIYKKLGVKNRMQAALKGKELGIV